jgi:hypothetical protein
LQHKFFLAILVLSFNTQKDFEMSSNLQTPSVFVLPDGRMTPKDAATYCGLSVKTLAIKRSQGVGPQFIKRGRVFYYKNDLDKWLTGGKVGSTAQARLMA